MKFFGLPERSAIGLDVGCRNVKAVQLSHGTRGSRVEAVACFPRSGQGGAVTRAEARRIADVLRRRSFVGNEVVVACASDKLLSATMEFPAKATGAVLDAAARNEFVRSQKCDAKAMEMTYWSLPAPARAAKTLNVMAVAYPHAEADALIEPIEAGGLEVVGMDVRTWASVRACGGVSQDAKGVVLLLDLGYGGATLVAWHRGVVIYERAMPEAGLRNVESAIAEQIRLPAEAARHYLFDLGLSSSDGGAADETPGEIRQILTGHLDAVAQDVTASMAYTSQQYPDAPVARAMLVGGGAMIPGLSDYLKAAVGVECQAATPLGCASASPVIAKECSPLLTTAAGLALFKDF
jgi:type IV pilus assembly protein PilM